ARRVKRAGYRLQFRLSDAVSTRMYRCFPEMCEGWTKNLALLFPNARELAVRRGVEFVLIAAGAGAVAQGVVDKSMKLTVAGAVAGSVVVFFFERRIRRAHFDSSSNVLAVFGLPLFALLLLRSHISHKRGEVVWKGRRYAVGMDSVLPANCGSLGYPR